MNIYVLICMCIFGCTLDDPVFDKCRCPVSCENYFGAVIVYSWRIVQNFSKFSRIILQFVNSLLLFEQIEFNYAISF